MMKNPCQPGEIIREEVIKPLGLTVTDAAKVLAAARPTLSNLLNENVSVTADMALRIEEGFGPTMEHLMGMQLAYDLAQARKREKTIKVKRCQRATRGPPEGHQRATRGTGAHSRRVGQR
jgi:antitoxin HigA-1